MSKIVELVLGNPAPIEVHKKDDSKDALSPDNRRVVDVTKRLGITPAGESGPDGTTTVVHIPASVRLAEAIVTVARLYTGDGDGYLGFHSSKPPAWIESDSNVLAQALAEHWSVDNDVRESLMGQGVKEGDLPDAHQVKVGRPKGWKDIAPPAGGGSDLWLPDTDHEYGAWLAKHDPWAAREFYRQECLRTNAGADFQSRVMGDTASTGTGVYAPGVYIALTENNTAPAAGDTTLTGELTAGGLGRAIATYAHTNGTTNYTLSKTFTSSDATPRTINKVGVFNAASTGTLVFTTAVGSPPTLQSGDSLTVTETVSLV